MSEFLTKRLISHDEANAAIQRLIDRCFNNPGKEPPRFGIPARPDYDDDLVLLAYIKQQKVRGMLGEGA